MVQGYTTVEQSKHLVELGLDKRTADMCYPHFTRGEADTYKEIPKIADNIDYPHEMPCWSLAALLEIIPRNLKIVLAVNDYWDGNAVKYKYAIGSVEHNNYDCYADNHVDACYELIIKLHEQNLL